MSYRHDQKTICKILNEHFSAWISHAKWVIVLPFFPCFPCLQNSEVNTVPLNQEKCVRKHKSLVLRDKKKRTKLTTLVTVQQENPEV